MGIFTFFIVVPEVIAGALFNPIVNALVPRLPPTVDVRLAIVLIGALIFAALLMLRVQDPTDPAKQ